ncbi:hypothetical protein ACFY0P_48970 [Streptomyces sp. NPDC001714]|uniref:hypothetical protein n=1 Tax=Streptomyces sp. NPDC001714 TaxID=3364603 RepID=UPI0036BB9B54
MTLPGTCSSVERRPCGPVFLVLLVGVGEEPFLVGADGVALRLVEVKGASRSAQEHLVGHLLRHLETWPQPRPDEPVSDGVPIVNHQHKLHPAQRTAAVYARPEFVASLDSLPVTVISTVELSTRGGRGLDGDAHGRAGRRGRDRTAGDASESAAIATRSAAPMVERRTAPAAAGGGATG